MAKATGKLQKILANKKLTDDMTIAIGDESFTLAELRQMDSDTDGGSTSELQTRLRDIETREGNLVNAQSSVATLLQTISDRVGVPIDDLIEGRLDGIKAGKPAGGGGGDESDPLAEIDPKVLAALEKKFGSGAVSAEVAAMKKELKDTRQALGIALRVNMDDYYQNTFRDLSKDIPEGTKLDLASVLKHADENNYKDKTGRLNLSKAVNDLTIEARHKAAIEAAKNEGIELGRRTTAAASMQRPGANRAELLKPPVDSKGQTHTIEHQLHEAMNDESIQRMLAGSVADA